MNVPLTSLVPAGVDDRATTWATLVAAFAADPAVRTLYPDDDDYHAHFPGFAEALGGRAFDAGFVDLYPAGFGAALWLPPGVAPDGDRIEAHLAATLPPARLQAMAAGFEAQAALHPREPHWYLPWIGVRPQLQGAGIGSTLLRQGLARVDADGMPAYLEATDRRNAALYARHGFQVTGIVLAPGYPQIITMRRPARAR